MVEREDGCEAESVDERVVGRDGGGGGNVGEWVGCVEGGRWWRRRRSAAGAGGGGVKEASALAATATTTALMEATEKGVAVKKVGWLKSSMPPTRATGGEWSFHAPLSGGCRGGPGSPHYAHPRKLRKGTDEDVIRVSPGHPHEIRHVPHLEFPSI